MITHINEVDFEREVLEEEKLVVVDFSAQWCMPCKMLSYVLESISEELDEIKIAQIDVDESPEISDEYEIQNIPAIKFFKDGNVIDEITGFIPKIKLVKMIKENL